MTSNNTHETDPRRNIPSVALILEDERIRGLMSSRPKPIVRDIIDLHLTELRNNLKPGDIPPSFDTVIEQITVLVEDFWSNRIRPVINATGIILHTGLGRAVLPKPAVEALATLSGCCNLQIDLENGKRGKRTFMTEYLLTKLTGAEAAMVVNNNAAATLLVLAALCENREVIVSRGQLIEIGGSFRLPDCIHQSGARLVEVGTTNKTHLYDYERAITENTGMILRVNPSNYRIIGFSEQVPIEQLVTLKKHHQVLVADDLGCGALVDLTRYGLPSEPTVQASIAAGADLVFFSGDKLISGPQAGIIVGKKELITKIKKHPLTRMLRICKLTCTALEETLKLFLDPETLVEHHPTIRMITLSPEILKKRAETLKKEINSRNIPLAVTVTACKSEVGGGSLPGTSIPSYGLALRSKLISSEMLAYRLRRNEPPIVTRIEGGDVMLDMRTLLEGEDTFVADGLSKIAESL